MEILESHQELLEKFSTVQIPNFNFDNISSIRNINLDRFIPKNPNAFQFERDIPIIDVAIYFHSNWSTAAFIAVAYLLVVFGLQEFMKDKKPVNLKWSLCAWNFLIGFFSLYGFLRSFPELWKFVGREFGFYESICIPNFDSSFIAAGILFAFSKIPELIDTVFVVLKKRPLEAVQWYHHVVTMFGCWICAPYFEPVSRYMVTINYGVHSMMYPYFALKAIGMKIPRGVAKIITTCQFAQMLICFVVNAISAFYYLSGTRYCHRHPVSLIYVLIGNLTFLAMFGNLFSKLVLKKSSPPKKSPGSHVKQVKAE